MSQVDYTIANASGSTVRSDLNDTFGAIVTLNSGSSAPSNTFSDMLWADSSVTPNIIKIRNAGDSAFKTLFSSDGQILTESGNATTPSHTFSGDPNTGASNPSANVYVISTAGVEKIRIKTPGVVINENGAADIDFRVESDTNDHMLFVDAGNERVVIGKSTGVGTLDVSHATRPKFVLSEEDQAADEKKWQIEVSASNLHIGPIPDGGGVSTNHFSLTRGAADTVLSYIFSDAPVVRVNSGVGSVGFALSTGSLNTGMYASGTDFIDFAVSGVRAFGVDSSGRLGVGVFALTNMVAGDMVLEGGSLALNEITTPTADTGYGKIYFKADNKIYAQTGDGVEHELAFV